MIEEKKSINSVLEKIYHRNLPILNETLKSYKLKRESIINKLANEFDKHITITSILNWKKQKSK